MRSTPWPLARSCAGALLCALTVLSSVPARAQEQGDAPSDADRAAAQVLFDAGRELIKAEEYEKACAKFAESMRLDRQIGTQLNLANCYEKLGRIASAWINFEEARARASKEGMADRVEIAAQRAEALLGRFSKMKIVVTTPVKGMQIHRDGENVGEPQWGTEVPIDGGEHVIEATAPGKKAWRTSVSVEQEQGSVEVVVPALKDAPVVVVPPSGGPAASDDTGLWIGAGVAGGLGLAGVGVGIAFGLIASGKNDDSAAECVVGPNECSAAGVALRDEAFTMAHISTVGFVVGGVGVATGVVLMVLALTNDDAGSAEGADAVSLVPSSEGAAVRWTW